MGKREYGLDSEAEVANEGGVVLLGVWRRAKEGLADEERKGQKAEKFPVPRYMSAASASACRQKTISICKL